MNLWLSTLELFCICILKYEELRTDYFLRSQALDTSDSPCDPNTWNTIYHLAFHTRAENTERFFVSHKSHNSTTALLSFLFIQLSLAQVWLFSVALNNWIEIWDLTQNHNKSTGFSSWITFFCCLHKQQIRVPLAKISTVTIYSERQVFSPQNLFIWQ